MEEVLLEGRGEYRPVEACSVNLEVLGCELSKL
jgi:hypothetical protein